MKERLENHASYKKLTKIINILELIEHENISTENMEQIHRINEIISILKDSIDRSDPDLISINSLKNIENNLNSIGTELTNFKNDNNTSRLTNIINHLENLLPIIPQFQIIKTPEEIEGVRNAVIKFRQSIGQHLSILERELEDTRDAYESNKTRFQELNKSMERHTKRIDNMLTDYQEKFLNGQEERNEKVSELINDTNLELKNIISNRESEVEEQKIEQEKSMNEFLAEQKQNFKDLYEKMEEKTKEEIIKIKKRNEEAEEILGTMSINSLANGYKVIADNEGKKAFYWNIISVLSLLAILGLGVHFILDQGTQITWSALTSRVIITGIGLTLFTYGAKQAGSHREEERRNRRVQVELASLNPYLIDLEEHKQKAVKESLVEKYFGVGANQSINNEQDFQEHK